MMNAEMPSAASVAIWKATSSRLWRFTISYYLAGPHFYHGAGAPPPAQLAQGCRSPMPRPRRAHALAGWHGRRRCGKPFPKSAVPSRHRFFDDARHLVAEPSAAESLGMTAKRERIEASIDCTSDRIGKGGWRLFVHEDAGFIRDHRLERAAAGIRDDRPAARL